MRASFTLFALIASFAIGAFARPERLAKRGGPIICTSNTDGSGETDQQVTKDCCAAVNQKAYFNEAEKECQPYGGHLGNSVDTGAMADCCSSRQRGSRSV